MKLNLILLLLSTLSYTGCTDNIQNEKAGTKDTIPPVINRWGWKEKVDTVYLNTTYKVHDLEVLDEVNGELRCTGIPIQVDGTVDTRLPGTYVLTYNATDPAGNKATPLTVTVHVVENPAAFLNGAYNVVSTCSAISGNVTEAVSTESYVANIGSGAEKNEFDLSALKIGPEYVAHSTSLNSNTINVQYFSTSYHFASSATGTLSPSKNSFTIDAKAYQFYPAVKYLCRNVYTKQLVLKQ